MFRIIVAVREKSGTAVDFLFCLWFLQSILLDSIKNRIQK